MDSTILLGGVPGVGAGGDFGGGYMVDFNLGGCTMSLTTEDTEGTEWKDASVTLPNDGETVIIHTLGGEVWTGFVDGDVWRNVAGARIHEEEPVLHWMPLPNPPEGGI